MTSKFNKERDANSTTTVDRRRLLQGLGTSVGLTIATGLGSTQCTTTTTDTDGEEDDEEFCRFDNEISFLTHSDRQQLELTTTGGIEKPNGRRVESVTATGPINYNYAGKISSFAMRGRGRVLIDQGTICSDEKVTTNNCVVGGTGKGFCEFNQTLSASTDEGETATITFGASHTIQLSEGGRRVPTTTFTVPANGRKTFAYAGWLTALAIDGKVDIKIEQSAPCADEYPE